VVGDIFDELYSQPETRIQLADALDFLVRCVCGGLLSFFLFFPLVVGGS
jgi:hypothetical protein